MATEKGTEFRSSGTKIRWDTISIIQAAPPSAFYLIVFCLIYLINLSAQTLENTTVDGYRGIWFELNQKYPYGDKYSGGLGTYTAKHMPMAIYVREVNKTFFVYGGTMDSTSRHLLCMIGSFDHTDHEVTKPVVVCDKQGVDDPHDNPSLLVDDDGYLWVFVSGRSTKRPGFKYRGKRPYDISEFELISEEEMTYPQPWFDAQRGFFHFFTKYTGTRELYFETSKDGFTWSDDEKIAGIVQPGYQKSGHYQVSGTWNEKVGTFFNRHQDGHPDTRTDLYYMESSDRGASWQNMQGQELITPLTQVQNAALIVDYQSRGRNVYMKDMQYDSKGHPICLYVTSSGHEPGPENIPYSWHITQWHQNKWRHSTITSSDHNYDMGSLFLTDSAWFVIGPTEIGPQAWAPGGEISIWTSYDNGNSWSRTHQVTANSKNNHTYVRRPLHASEPFYFYWADGDPSRISTSRLFFGDLRGQVWQLPYHMNSDKQGVDQINPIR